MVTQCIDKNLRALRWDDGCLFSSTNFM